MIKAIDLKLAFDINVALRYDRRPPKPEAQALVQSVHMPEDDLLLLRNQRRVVPQRFHPVVAACLTQPGCHRDEMPRYRRSGDVNRIETLEQTNSVGY